MAAGVVAAWVVGTTLGCGGGDHWNYAGGVRTASRLRKLKFGLGPNQSLPDPSFSLFHGAVLFGLLRWYNNGKRCSHYITIYGNGKSVKAKVVDECDSTRGCDDDIVDASKAASPAPTVVDLLLLIEQSKGGGDPAWHEQPNPDIQGRHHQSDREFTSKNGGARSSLSSLPLQPPHITECLVSDDTGTIVFIARNDQVDIMKPGTTVILRNAKIDMFIKGTMRLVVDKWGRVEVTEPASFEVKEVNNLSLVEYELLSVAESDQKS
ncbi:uncharacterized protein LOC133716678 [Rosa rugosa]|uniref:uncharacterized protein LOC133716678 n=1 Tax=Rosa rugosa TaxID=74645 RepID=UPI002B40ACA9|nr:uncharacterized protein LOC133716678 [Rosa rugosa]